MTHSPEDHKEYMIGGQYISTYCQHGDHTGCRLACKGCHGPCACGCGHVGAVKVERAQWRRQSPSRYSINPCEWMIHGVLVLIDGEWHFYIGTSPTIGKTVADLQLAQAAAEAELRKILTAALRRLG